MPPSKKEKVNTEEKDGMKVYLLHWAITAKKTVSYFYTYFCESLRSNKAKKNESLVVIINIPLKLANVMTRFSNSLDITTSQNISEVPSRVSGTAARQEKAFIFKPDDLY